MPATNHKRRVSRSTIASWLCLAGAEGATVTEMMEASGWQQHSVRGFLAGTIKKKLGFILTSSKTAGELRRYRIDAKRGR